MARQKSLHTLDIYLNALPLGQLSYKAKQSLAFTYKPEWLNKANSFPISRSLPLREEPYEGPRVYAYFDNLLPDIVSIRQRVAARMHAKSDEVFDLLGAIGRDCVGALQFTQTNEKKPLLAKPTGCPLSESEIASRLRNLSLAPLAISEEEDFRLSVAGAQEKTAFLFLDGQWQIPLGSTPTTHIFKPQIGEIKPGLSFADSVENEWLCAKIVEAFGIPVAGCEIQCFEDVKTLVVERFDRAWHGNILIRLPQEDMCQSLGIPNFKKYENDGGPGIVSIMDLLNESLNREENRTTFIKTQIVFLLLAAIDGHAKNFSIAWRPSGFEMTPLYDILSAQPLIDKGVFQFEKQKMAMAFGDNRHWKIKDICRRHLLQTAKLCRYDVHKMEKLIDETLDQVPVALARAASLLKADFPDEIATSIFNGVRQRISRFAK